jgi:hypothetical protein
VKAAKPTGESAKPVSVCGRSPIRSPVINVLVKEGKLLACAPLWLFAEPPFDPTVGNEPRQCNQDVHGEGQAHINQG